MPGSMRPWAEALSSAGFTVSVPLLPGHGTTWQDANKCTWEDWYGGLERAFDDIRADCTHTFVAGLSMGGTLVTSLAEQRGAEIAGVIVVNGAFFTTRKDAKLLTLLRWVVPSLPPVGNDIKKAGVTEPAYDRVPVRAAYQMMRGWKDTNAEFAKVTQPLLVLTSREDHVVEKGNSERLLERAGSTDKRQIWLEDSFHVATMDNDLPLIIEESTAFIKAHT
jgi:carboxylesterase